VLGCMNNICLWVCGSAGTILLEYLVDVGGERFVFVATA